MRTPSSDLDAVRPQPPLTDRLKVFWQVTASNIAARLEELPWGRMPMARHYRLFFAPPGQQTEQAPAFLRAVEKKRRVVGSRPGHSSSP
jgi:hypothetical protein